jgi:pilus assembly protein CpaB
VNTVTLAVTPEEAEKLALASNDGKIQLVMRHFADAAKVETPGSDKSGLLGQMLRSKPSRAGRSKGSVEKKAPAGAPPPVQVVRNAYVVEVIKGGKRSEERFE